MSKKSVIKKTISVGQANPEDVAVSHARLIVVMAVFAIIFFILSLRIAGVALFGKDSGSSSSYANSGYNEIFKKRADIVDRNGALLAVNLTMASLYANPKVVMDASEAVTKLEGVFPNIASDTIKKRLLSDKSFVWIKRNITPEEQYEVNALGLPGLYFKEEEKRVYPHKWLFSHTLGVVDIDGNGISGIEKQFDSYLKKPDAKPLQLSLDMRVQSIVRDALLDAVIDFGAIGASSVVLDANTGEVIAMVSLPDFNPNNPGASSVKNKFNRSTYGVYEMGSTFKTFNMALGFELGDISMQDKYDVSKPIRLSGFTIRDYHPRKGSLNVSEIFMYSSNIGSAKIAMDIGAEEQKGFLKRLGLLGALEIELPEKSEPLYPKRWSKTSAMTISYGHGIAVTPMHMVKATASLVNGGMLNPVTLLRKSEGEHIDGKRVVSIASSDRIRKLLRFAVKYGTGSKADSDGYLVGGKTGSADKAIDGKYNVGKNISSFIAAFPMNKPRYVVLVMLDEPIGNASTGWYATGGMVAAPVVNNIIMRMAPIVGVMPVDGNDYEIRREFWYDGDKSKQQMALSGDH